MSKTLAELRAEPPKTRPERSVTICLAPHLVAEVQELIDELDAIPAPGQDDQGPVRKMGEGENPRAAEIRARMAELLAEMAEHEGEMRVAALVSEGEWRRWAVAHPAREEGEPGWRRDQEVAAGYCNADDLMNDLGRYAYSWAGDPLGAGDWDLVFKENVPGPDKKKMAEAVIAMYESRLDFREWRSGLSATLTKLSDSASPETSTSAPADSTGGNPSQSSEATTETATKSP